MAADKVRAKFLHGAVKAWCFELAIALRPIRHFSHAEIARVSQRGVLLGRADSALAAHQAAVDIDAAVPS